MRRRGTAPLALLLALALGPALPGTTAADVPYPPCLGPGCNDPHDYASYLFLAPGQLPNDFDPNGGDAWKFQAGTGMDVLGAWQVTTGRPDTVVAILDSGIRWNDADLARKVALNTGELPLPPGCAVYDCNGDGVVNVDDYAGAGVPDSNGNGFLDAEDLIRFYADGVDQDGNGYVDDIAGWDFDENDDDPFDDVDYGHGTGEAHDQVAEANNGSGTPGVAPSAMFLPLKVADSFVAVDADFARAVVYAVDRRVDVISEALGTISASRVSQGAIDYAYRSGIPIIASAADEESRHHNVPAALEHTLWVNSIRDGDGSIVAKTADHTLLNGCTNYGGHAWVAVPSSSCSSEATGRAAGLALLMVSHGKNLIERGLLSPYPGLDQPFSAEEIRQLFRRAAVDIDQSANRALPPGPFGALLQALLSAPGLGLVFESTQFATEPGWDQFTGYGRIDGVRLLDVTADTIPPEADLSGGLRWFDVIDPARRPSVPVRGSAAALRAGGSFDYTVEVGCGVQPAVFTAIGSGSASARLERALLATWDPAATAFACGFDPGATIDDPDAHTVTLRLQVRDRLGNLGEDRRTVAIHHDASLRFMRDLGASGESSPVLADVDRDGILDVVLAASDGRVHALRGSDGSEIPGFPVETDEMPHAASPGYASGVAPIPHEPVVAAAAADDLGGDGRVEIVVASTEGKVYVFDDHGRRRAGFPVATDPAFSRPENRDRVNDSDPGILAAPTLADLDPPGGDPRLEILVGAMDGHLYAWHADGSPVAGFPVRLADRTKVSVDEATGKATPLAGADVKERGAKIVGSPAVGDLDGDGRPEIVVPTNEEYGQEPGGFAIESTLLNALVQLGGGLGGFTSDVQGRLYVVQPDGNLHAGGPFRPGWPARVPLLVSGLLPTVATGTSASPALADLDGSGHLATAISGSVGPAILFDADGQPTLGSVGGQRRALATDFPNGGFPNVPPSAGSGDAPFLGALGSGAFGDLDGDGLPEYVEPTGGLRALLDVGLPGRQAFADHSITAWNPRTGALLPAFPRRMDDMQFLGSPALGDVDGDGHADVVQGSGGYLVRAYRADGATPAGWPKFTHGWLLASPALGDVDGDGKIEVVAVTREGNLFVWDTPAAATAAALPWQGFGRDRRHTQNLASGVSPLAAPADPLAGLAWALESIQLDFQALLANAPPDLAKRLLRSTAPRGLELALRGLARHQLALEIAGLPLAELGLRSPRGFDGVLDDLHQRLIQAVSAAAHGVVDTKQCAPGDSRCASGLHHAADFLLAGDQAALGGSDGLAVQLWALALAFAG